MLGSTDSKQSGLASSAWAGFSMGDIKSLPSLNLPVSSPKEAEGVPREPKGLEQGVASPKPPRGEGIHHIAPPLTPQATELKGVALCRYLN